MQTKSFASSFQVLTVILAFGAASCGRDPRPGTVSGTIETDEVRVASRYGGRVEKLSAQEGDVLREGQVIAELDAAELRSRRDRQAAQLAEMEAGPRQQEIDAAKHDWEAQAANWNLAQADAQRAEGLFAKNTISVTERDQATTRARALESNVAAAKSRYDLLLAGTRPEQLAQARAQVAETDSQLREMRIVAPSESVLEVLSVKVGDVLAPNQQVAILLLSQHIWARVYVPETWLGNIHVADTVHARVDGFPGKEFQGVVEQVNRSAEFTPRNVQTVEERIKQVFGVKVRFDSAARELRPGMSVDIEFPGVNR